MTTEFRSDDVRRRAGRHLVCLVTLGLVMAALAGCSESGDRGQSPPESMPEAATGRADTLSQRSGEAAANSSVRPSSRPLSDLVTIAATIAEYSIELSRDTIDSGKISLLLQNDGRRPHTIEVRGDNGMRWTSLPIPPGRMITMSMRIEAGHYAVSSRDSAYVERGMRGEFHVR